MNAITITGRIVKDIELKESEKAVKYAMFTVADNQGKERTAFIDCFATGRTAENIAKWFSKGSPISILGELRQNMGKTKNGDNNTKYTVYVEKWAFVPQSKKASVEIASDNDDMPF